jgi:hypothetical protein
MRATARQAWSSIFAFAVTLQLTRRGGLQMDVGMEISLFLQPGHHVLKYYLWDSIGVSIWCKRYTSKLLWMP